LLAPLQAVEVMNARMKLVPQLPPVGFPQVQLAPQLRVSVTPVYQLAPPSLL
jgi:hypothetical protein